MNSVQEQIGRLKLVYKSRTDIDLAKAMNKDKNTIGSWKKRGGVPTQTLKMVSLEESVSMEWLVSGTGSMRSTSTADTIDTVSMLGGLFSDERSIKIVNLLKYAPPEFIDKMVERLEEYKRLSDI